MPAPLVPAPNVDVAPNAEDLAQRAAAWLLHRVQSATERFTIALSGGSTPRRLYQILATAPYADTFPWRRTHLFWGDERFVPHTEPLSNYRMVREALLDHVPIPPENIHAAPFAGTPRQAAETYQADLQRHYGHAALQPGRPLFDVTLLGLGTDGHTASLFPGTPALAERTAWITAVTENVPQPRLTLTFPAIAHSHAAAFLVTGSDKAEPLRRVLEGDQSLPAAHVTADEVFWFVDAAAKDTGSVLF